MSSKGVTNDRKYKSLSPTTTEEEQIVTAGQRVINLIWERTQSQIAKVTVYAGVMVNMAVILVLILLHNKINTDTIVVIIAALGSMNTTTGIIIGFYFSRTNHSAIGGVGKKEAASGVGTR